MISSLDTQKADQNIAFLGIDIGGTSSKIAVLATMPLKSIKNHLQITLHQRKEKFYLYNDTVNSIEQLYKILAQLKGQLGENIKVCGTGGGNMLYSEAIKQLLGVKVVPLSEFEAHARGLQFYKNAHLPVQEQLYSKISQTEILLTKKQSSLKQYKEILFMSLGSGVNFQLYGEGERGFERQQTKDPQLTKSGDGYFLEGSSLGAGFLMGVGKLCTGQTEYKQILAKLKQQGQLRQIYQGFFVNLFLMAINMVLLHQRYNLLFSGKILSFEQNYSEFFIEALKQTIGLRQIQISIICLKELEGFLGALGAIQNLLDE